MVYYCFFNHLEYITIMLLDIKWMIEYGERNETMNIRISTWSPL